MNKRKNNLNFVAVFTGVVLLGALSISIFASQQNQEHRGRAATSASANVQLQCSSGKIQVLISFTNPESYPVDLSVEDVDLNVQKDYQNISAGQTKTDTITTAKTSVANGTFSMVWFPTDVNNTADPGDLDKNYTALNCGTSASPTQSTSPTVSLTTSPTTTTIPGLTTTPGVSTTITPSTTQIPSTTPSIPTGKKAAADINDDGFVNQVDYNLFLREISTQPGQ